MIVEEVGDFFTFSSRDESCLSYYKFESMNLTLVRFSTATGYEVFFMNMYPKLRHFASHTLDNLTERDFRYIRRMTKKTGLGDIGLGATGSCGFKFVIPTSSLDKVVHYFQTQINSFGVLACIPEVDFFTYKDLENDEMLNLILGFESGDPINDFTSFLESINGDNQIERLLKLKLLPLVRSYFLRMNWAAFDNEFLPDETWVRYIAVTDENILVQRLINLLDWPIFFNHCDLIINPPVVRPIQCSDHAKYTVLINEISRYKRRMIDKYSFLDWDY